MKKFLTCFLCYIGLIFFAFNPSSAEAKNSIPLPFTDDLARIAGSESQKPLIRTDNEFIKLLAVFLLADKLYPDEKINDDMIGFLHRVWPKANIETLKTFSLYIKTFVMLKRRYNYVTEGLKLKIKAAGILPHDSPIIAKDGEFAPIYPEGIKSQTAPNAYKVKYTPYKYLGYDKGELGEPVRLRDKNYEPVKEEVLDELVLSILEFDFKRFYTTIKKMPQINDGTREKPVELENGVKTRLLLDMSALGKAETIDGVMEVYVPRGWYINGDFLNPKSKPKFFLSEDKNEDLNIKEYQIFYPDAIGTVKNNKTHRIWINSIRFPMKFTRRDTNKGLNIKGTFTFELCQAKTDICHQLTSQNSLFVGPSDFEEYSMHSNFISVGFSRVPQQTTKHAKLHDVVYNKQTGELTLTFNTTKTFSNVAAMAEDAVGTSFINPQYNITDKQVTVTFASDTSQNMGPQNGLAGVADGGEIAVTAAFDEYEILRTVITPETTDTFIKKIPQKPDYTLAYLFGFLLNLMPAIFYLLQRLLTLFIEHEKRYKILLRYTLSTLIGLVIFAVHNSYYPWFGIYENSWLLTTALLLAVSYTVSLLGYIDFNLFRPLKGKIRRGVFIGLFTVLFMAAIPLPYKTEVLNNLTEISLLSKIKTYIIIWFGMITLPLLVFVYRRYMTEYPLKMRYINLSYILFFVAEILWLIYAYRGLSGLTTALIASIITAALWYLYPEAITASISYKRSLKNKAEVFFVVQKHATIAILVIWLATGIILSFIKVADSNVLSVEETISVAQNDLTNNKETLLILTPRWEFPLFNRQNLLEVLEHKGIHIINYYPSAYNLKAQKWLKTYDRASPPLHVLFTKRHPKGLALPKILHEIDWNEALKTFEPIEKKEQTQ